MRVIVTGASGFIGRNVLLRAPRDWEILAVYHQTSELEGDLLNPGDVRALSAAAGGRADAALYLAANGDPAASAERPRWDLESNTVAPVTFLEQCSVAHLVYVSSGAVYDGLVGPVSPSTPVSPRLPYAISKLAAEQYVRFFAERRHALDSFINVRFFGAYGPFEPSRKITTRWIRAVMAGQREFTIRGSGENLIDFMYVDDAVDGFLTMVRASAFSGTIDFASRAPVSINQVVGTMARVLGADIHVRHESHTEEFIQFHTVDTTLRDRFGIAPTISFEEGIRKLHGRLLQEGSGVGQPS
jgi:UDP-glucose 4-epimerase